MSESTDPPWANQPLQWDDLSKPGDKSIIDLQRERYEEEQRAARMTRFMKANYVIVEDDADQNEPLIIRDVGHDSGFASVTNAAETVVAELHADGQLPKGRTLYYFDSEGDMDELLHDGAGQFLGFKPGPDAATRPPKFFGRVGPGEPHAFDADTDEPCISDE